MREGKRLRYPDYCNMSHIAM
uniref:Uncharacterized protein n=1 Tax=Arundo donax TaxID=35708 RepID=A0A0A8ZCD3_ARUDO